MVQDGPGEMVVLLKCTSPRDLQFFASVGLLWPQEGVSLLAE